MFAKNCVDDDDELYIRGFVDSVVKTRKKPEAEPNQTPLSKLATSKIREKKRAKTNEDRQTETRNLRLAATAVCLFVQRYFSLSLRKC